MTAVHSDVHWMSQALQQARKGLFTTSPNPRVGCVLVKNDQLLASGFHHRAGEPHAERNALNQLSAEQSSGATCYVTLEPCSHTGRTGPCANALIDAGVARVVVAIRDPNPLVAGQGIAVLQAAGIAVTEGVLATEAARLNQGFIKRFTRQHPWVTVKLAISLDGRTAMASGESFWITDHAAREDVQRLRARSCAIVTGMGTLLADNPAMTVRADGWQHADYPGDWVRQPLRVLVSTDGLDKKPDQKLFADSNVLVVTAGQPAAQRTQELGVAAIAVGADGPARVDLFALLKELAARGCNEVLVEAGATLSAAFVEQNLVDELVVYQAPLLLGQSARPALALDIATMNDKRVLTLVDARCIGQDWRYIFALES